MRTPITVLVLMCSVLLAEQAWAQCASNADCRGGRVCQEGQCVAATDQSCGKDTDCPDPMVCNQSKCAMPQSGAPATTAPAPAPAPSASSPKQIIYAEEEVQGVPSVWVPGIITFGVTYLATVGITAGVDGNGERIGLAAIPIFGPFALMPDASDDYIAPLAIAGVFQVAGVGFFIAGLLMTRTVRTPVGVALGEGDDAMYLNVMPGPVGTMDSYGLNFSLTQF